MGYAAAIAPHSLPQVLHNHLAYANFPTGSCFCGYHDIKLNQERIIARKAAFSVAISTASNETAKAAVRKEYGIHLPCPILPPYATELEFFPIPLMHAGLLGISKMVLNRLFPSTKQLSSARSSRPALVFSNKARKLISFRAGLMSPTFGFGRWYRDVVLQRGYWTSEEHLLFLDFSYFILAEEEGSRTSIWPSANAKEAWSLLRSAMRHYFQSDDAKGTFTMQLRQEAQSKMMDFAKLWEGLAGPRGCTSTLHLFCCRLFDQETQLGPASKSSEWWVERGILAFKSSVVTPRGSEIVFVNQNLLKLRLAAAANDPDIARYSS